MAPLVATLPTALVLRLFILTWSWVFIGGEQVMWPCSVLSVYVDPTVHLDLDLDLNSRRWVQTCSGWNVQTCNFPNLLRFNERLSIDGQKIQSERKKKKKITRLFPRFWRAQVPIQDQELIGLQLPRDPVSLYSHPGWKRPLLPLLRSGKLQFWASASLVTPLRLPRWLLPLQRPIAPLLKAASFTRMQHLDWPSVELVNDHLTVASCSQNNNFSFDFLWKVSTYWPSAAWLVSAGISFSALVLFSWTGWSVSVRRIVIGWWRPCTFGPNFIDGTIYWKFAKH